MLRFVSRAPGTLPPEAEQALRPYAGVTARLLYARGVTNAQQAEAFLKPSLDMLNDPMLLSDMEKVLLILEDARKQKLPTVVYGDYDADGICACALLTQTLRRFGLEADPHVPLRSEGYGLNEQAVRLLAKKYRLMVTVDLGITNHNEVRLAQSLGMTVIVTDHHGLALEPSPADAAINPLLNGYPFGRLCGAGVAFKLAQALIGLENCMDLLDLAALATVADIVPLTGENRVITAKGLPIIARRGRVGLRALLRVSGDPATVDSETLGFRLGPRLNAAGRLGDANKAVRLLMTDDPAEADTLAEEMDALNTERKSAESMLMREAEAKAAAHDFIASPALIVKGENWNVGVIGLAAGRLCQKYACPVCVLSESEGMLHGSLRSVPGVHIHNCLKACDDLLARYGGHELAAGVTLKAENETAFRERLNAEVAKADPECFKPLCEYDAEIPLESCTEALLDELTQLEPYGCGNPSPVFLTRGLALDERRAVGAEGAHLKLTVRKGTRAIGGIAFSMGPMASTLPNRVDAAYSLSRNTFRGVTSLQLEVAALEPMDEARVQALEQPENTGAEQNAMLDALLQMPQCAKEYLPEPRDWYDLSEALCQNARGMLLAARTGVSAARALKLKPLELMTGGTNDPRCYNTVLHAPVIQNVMGSWRQIWLLDGELFPGEAALWREQLPQAEIYVLPGTSIKAIAAGIDAGDECYRDLYRLLRAGSQRTLMELAEAAGLTWVQTRAGLIAFDQLGLIRYKESPFAYVMMPPVKCSLGNSGLLQALRRIA